MSQTRLKFKDSPYQYTRGIRFRAEPQRQGRLFKEKSQLKKSPVNVFDLFDLAKQLLDFHVNLKELLFYPSEGEKSIPSQANQLPVSRSPDQASSSVRDLSSTSPLSKKSLNSSHKRNGNFYKKGLSINKSWLKAWHKDIFYLWIKNSNNKQGKYTLSDIAKSHRINREGQNPEGPAQFFDLQNWIDKWREKSLILKRFSERSQDEQIRDSEIAEIVRFFLNRGQWDYIHHFLTELNTKEAGQDEQIEELKNSLENLWTNLKSAERAYLSSQSSGIEIAKASFNYYTLNKKPKADYDKKLLLAQTKLYGFCREPKSRKLPHKSSSQMGIKGDNPPSGEKSFKPHSLAQERQEMENTRSFSVIKKVSDKNNNISYQWGKISFQGAKSGKASAICPGQHQKKEECIFCFKSAQEKEWIERVCKSALKGKQKKSELESACPAKEARDRKNKFAGNLDHRGVFLSLDQTYALMKAFKAEQKSIFYEVMAHIASEQNKSYTVNNLNHILNGYEFPYKKLNFKNINKEFSLFEFKDKTVTNPQYTVDKALSQYKDNRNKVAADKVYECFVNLTNNIQRANNPGHKSHIKNKTQHPKHRFLSIWKNRFKNQQGFGSGNLNQTLSNQPNKLQHPTGKTFPNNKQSTKDRGAFLFGGKNCYFKGYGRFCEIYKQTAQNRGRLIAQIKGIERERREALQTDFWSLIYCGKNKRQLWLVPKEKRQEAWQCIYNGKYDKKEPDSESAFLCCFESLTMRALHKLCFAEQSSFAAEMPPNLQQLQKGAKQFKTEGDEQKLKEKNLKKLEFFKQLLKSDYANEKLKLDSFNLQPVSQAQSLEKFEKSLEKACYHIKKIALTEKEKQDFLKNFDVTALDISSYDLKGRNKKSPDRLHTDWWKAFWDSPDQPDRDKAVLKSVGSADSPADRKNQPEGQPAKSFHFGEIRLNPEAKIRYREADEELKKYFAKKKFPDTFKHRGLNEQWTAHFTLALNAGKKYEELAFSKPEEILQKISAFNRRLNQEMDFKTAWKYGIDRGQKELAALCLAKFNPDKDIYKVSGKTILRPTFPNGPEDIKCWTLRDCNYSEEYKTTKGKKNAMRLKIFHILLTINI